MNALKKVKLRLFILDLIFEIVVNSIILVVAWFSNRIIETLLFYFAWRVFRYCVPKIFHIKMKSAIMSVIGCGICSIACFIVAMQLMLPINITLFWSILIGAFMNDVLYLMCDYRDLKESHIKLKSDIYNMSEEELRNYCKRNDLSEMIIDTVVLRVIHNYKWVEIMNERHYTKEGIRYHKKRIYQKLKIKL